MFNDNRKVKDNHQEGIERVKQRKGDMEKGQSGYMGKDKNKKDTFSNRTSQVPKSG